MKTRAQGQIKLKSIEQMKISREISKKDFDSIMEFARNISKHFVDYNFLQALNNIVGTIIQIDNPDVRVQGMNFASLCLTLLQSYKNNDNDKKNKVIKDLSEIITNLEMDYITDLVDDKLSLNTKIEQKTQETFENKERKQQEQEELVSHLMDCLSILRREIKNSFEKAKYSENQKDFALTTEVKECNIMSKNDYRSNAKGMCIITDTIEIKQYQINSMNTNTKNDQFYISEKRNKVDRSDIFDLRQDEISNLDTKKYKAKTYRKNACDFTNFDEKNFVQDLAAENYSIVRKKRHMDNIQDLQGSTNVLKR